MTNAEVLKLTPLEQFLFWITERQKIFLKRQNGKPKPWTDNEALRDNFFTNVHRENDKVTVWFRENVRKELVDNDRILLATVIFRWFNLPATGHVLLGDHFSDVVKFSKEDNLLTDWNEEEAVRRLRKAAQGGKVPVFTGAYMIKAGNGEPGIKIPSVCAAITNVWKQRQRLITICKEDCRLEALWKELTQFKHLGGFMSYEIVCDLRYTHLLNKATDINTWANPGPGALRGLLRLEGGTIPINSRGGPKRAVTVKDPLKKMINLLDICHKRLPSWIIPKFELREVEQILCEFDKFIRALDIMRGVPNAGKMKRKYDGKGNQGSKKS